MYRLGFLPTALKQVFRPMRVSGEPVCRKNFTKTLSHIGQIDLLPIAIDILKVVTNEK
jgi:hypothetical protein